MAQFDIKWSELMRVGGHVNRVYPVAYSDFYTTRYQGTRLYSSLYLTNHSGFKETAKGKVAPKLDRGFGIIEQVELIKNTPIVFISDKKDGVHKMYYQKYSSACEPIGLPKEITSYEMPRQRKRKGDFWIHFSANKQFFCIDYEIPGSKTEHDRFGYRVYSDEFELISQGEYELPYPSRLVTITNNHVSNNGNYFLTAKVYKDDDSRKLFKSLDNLEKVVLIHITPEGMEEFDLELEDEKRISDLSIGSNEQGILTFTGLYGNKKGGTKGAFFYKFDYQNKKVLVRSWKPFYEVSDMDDWTEKDLKREKKLEKKGRSMLDLHQFDIRDLYELEDGSLIGMIERYYVRVVTTYDQQTNRSSTTYYYHYEDIKVYKINPGGEIMWIKDIPKRQVSANDDGYLSSFSSFVTGGKLYVMFNDNLKNYNESSGIYETGDAPFTANYRKKKNTVALVEMDLENGDYTRKSYFGRKETEALAVPKKFVLNPDKKELTMILRIGKKEKYGILSLE
ncbi:MAG: hypothetical protein EP338_11655 [Bacteroidetes bacterium]|nr:MAG: hypothetical protein EP338_11655 [Bacteroidota bacterium]